jgi:AbrB family looped-hinge helix DNA binding protein
METTKLSSKGQVVLPRAIREAHGWAAGVRFVVEDRGKEIVLRPADPFPETTIEDVIGCTGYRGPRRSLQEMEAAIAAGAKE